LPTKKTCKEQQSGETKGNPKRKPKLNTIKVSESGQCREEDVFGLLAVRAKLKVLRDLPTSIRILKI
jgi:hypothetical protein